MRDTHKVIGKFMDNIDTLSKLAIAFKEALDEQDRALRMTKMSTVTSEADKQTALELANARLVAAVRAICAE